MILLTTPARQRASVSGRVAPIFVSQQLTQVTTIDPGVASGAIKKVVRFRLYFGTGNPGAECSPDRHGG